MAPTRANPCLVFIWAGLAGLIQRWEIWTTMATLICWSVPPLADLYLLKNLGDSTVPDWKHDTSGYAGISAEWWAYPALGDVTGDGALDLFVGAGNGQLLVYHNEGTPGVAAWPSSPTTTLSAGGSAAPTLDDLDGDGDLDLLVGNDSGQVSHFENTGTTSSPQWTRRGDNYAGVSEPDSVQPCAIDLDGDGDRDLLVGLCGQLVWYRRSGSAQNPTWSRVGSDPVGSGGGSCAISPAAGDWDGDSDRDLILGEHWGDLRQFRNENAPNWADAGTMERPIDIGGDSAPALTDWDGDGDLDLMLGNAWGQVHQFTNMGDADEPDWRHDDAPYSVPWTNHPHAFPAFADIDGDNDVDLFIGEGGWNGPGSGGNIHHYRNEGTPSAPNWQFVTDSFLGLDVGGWSTPAFCDINNDGDLDLFVGDEDGTLTFVENQGTVTAPAWATPIQPYYDLDLGEQSAPSFFDMDQDGDLDMLVGTAQGSLAFVRNTGNEHSPDWELVATGHPGIQVGNFAVPATGDLNGDGQPELLVGDGDGGINLYEYDGPGLAPASLTEFSPGDHFALTGKLRIYSPAIDASTPLASISASGNLTMRSLYTEDGQPLAYSNDFLSTWLTPSGLPIEGIGSQGDWALGQPVEVGGFEYLGGHAIEADVAASGQIPLEPQPGTYQIELIMHQFFSVPTNNDWRAAYIMHYTSGGMTSPITVRDASATAVGEQPRHLIWRLLANTHSQGTRGTGAREDDDLFGLTTEIVTQSPVFIVPPIDERSGDAITYRLEPHLPMLSYCDRRMPSHPLLAFDLPGGELRVSVQQPDGSVRGLGSATIRPILQSLRLHSIWARPQQRHSAAERYVLADDWLGAVSHQLQPVWSPRDRHAGRGPGSVGELV